MSRTRVRRIPFVAAVAFMGIAFAAAVVAGILGGSTSDSSAQVAEDRQVGFLDQFTGTYLTTQLGAGHPDYGQFTVAVDGVGVAWPETAGTAVVDGGGVITLSYNGPATLDASATTDSLWGWNFMLTGGFAPAQD